MYYYYINVFENKIKKTTEKQGFPWYELTAEEFEGLFDLITENECEGDVA